MLRARTGKLQNISPDHGIFVSRLATSGMIPALKDKLLPLNTSGRCDVTKMTASGVPPHINQQRQIAELVSENQRLRLQLDEQHNTVMTELPALVSANILENVAVQGAQQMSSNDMRAMIQGLLETYSMNGSSSAAAAVVAPPASPETDIDGYSYFAWGGMMGRPVPAGWRFPHPCQVKTMCDMFQIGIPALKVRPFKKIHGCNLLRADQSYFYRAESVFNYIVQTAIGKGITTQEEMKEAGILRWDVIFAAAFSAELELREVPLRKPGSMSINTYYDKLTGKK